MRATAKARAHSGREACECSRLDADGDPLAYGWTQFSGPAAVLSDASAASPTFVAWAEGVVIERLEVSDGIVWSLPSDVTITIVGANHAPVASAGAVGDTVVLDGSASSDPEGAALGFAWTQTSGPTVQLQDGQQARASFVAAQVGVHEFSLTVSDGQSEASAAVQVEIVAEARSASSCGGCSGSDADSGPLVVGAVLLLLVGMVLRRRRWRPQPSPNDG